MNINTFSICVATLDSLCPLRFTPLSFTPPTLHAMCILFPFLICSTVYGDTPAVPEPALVTAGASFAKVQVSTLTPRVRSSFASHSTAPRSSLATANRCRCCSTAFFNIITIRTHATTRATIATHITERTTAPIVPITIIFGCSTWCRPSCFLNEQ